MTDGVASDHAKRLYTAKVVLVGPSGVGKTCIGNRFAKGKFNESTSATIVAAYMTKTVKLDAYEVRLEIWDTAGQERFHSLAHMYYRNASAAIITYDITNAATFDAAQTWLRELASEGVTEAVALCGNKADLSASRAVPTEMARKYADEHKLLFFETSALNGDNITSLFHALAARIPSELLTESDESDSKLILLDDGAGGQAGSGDKAAASQQSPSGEASKKSGCC